MTTSTHRPAANFDSYASWYDEGLARGLAVSGEDKEYFVHGRINWLAGCLAGLGAVPSAILDFGCGTGSSAPVLRDVFSARRVIGVDVSDESLDRARRSFGSPECRFQLPEDFHSAEEMDLAFCNGVFHHIPVDGRQAAVRFVRQSLKPGGVFAFWENNPWNPGTRYVMSRIPFDRDAITLTPPEARDLLRRGGFEVLRTDYLFIFPKMLRWGRGLEPYLSRLPLGAQYQVLCRKPRIRSQTGAAD